MAFGSIGLGYFIYGKKQGKGIAMLAGFALMACPYLIAGTVWLVLVSLALMAAPFMVDL
jgi:hypothetical protein